MKQFLSVILALALMLTLALPAFAADVTGESTANGSASQEVTAEYVAPTDDTAGKIYRVTITWEPTEEEDALTYTGKHTVYKWNPETLKYEANAEGTTEAGWTGAAGYEVTVANRSNAAVDVKMETTNTYDLTVNTVGDVEMTLGSAAVKDNEEIAYSDTEAVGTEQTAEVTFTYSANDTASALDAEQNTVGKITVTVTGK